MRNKEKALDLLSSGYDIIKSLILNINDYNNGVSASINELVNTLHGVSLAIMDDEDEKV